MKFLLTAVNAKYIHSNPAVYSLRAYAGKENEKHIEIAEYTINQRTEVILAEIYKRRPDVIAFSCYIWNMTVIGQLLEELPKLLPEVPIWLGGPEVSFDAPQILEKYPGVSGVMAGEGEETFLALLQYYLAETKTDLRQIAGLVFRCGRENVSTGVRELTDLSRLPFFYENMEDFRNRIVYYESARGCPYRCSYCLSSIDKRVRFRDMETVKRELQFFFDSKVTQVKFVDRTFNCDRERTREIWTYLTEHDNGITNFHFEIAADSMTEEELALLSPMRPGLVQLEIGVQSANQQTLREINRFTDMDQIKKVVDTILKGENVHVHLDLIAGLPYEDYTSFGHSFDVVYRMHPHQLQLGFLKVLKGSPMHEKAAAYGINYTSAPPYEVLYSKWLPYEDVCRLKQIEEMVELYYNSNQFTHTLPVLEKAFASAFNLFEKLAGFYEENGYFTNSPSRSYRYEVLLAFACRYDREREPLYRELLTYDLYLRENLKSRPVFAADLSVHKERVRSFYEREEKERRLLPSYRDCQAKQMAKMTHMEFFSYHVWEECGDRRAEKAVRNEAVLFDYKKRNPLTGEAEILVLTDETTKEREQDDKEG